MSLPPIGKSWRRWSYISLPPQTLPVQHRTDVPVFCVLTRLAARGWADLAVVCISTLSVRGVNSKRRADPLHKRRSTCTSGGGASGKRTWKSSAQREIHSSISILPSIAPHGQENPVQTPSGLFGMSKRWRWSGGADNRDLRFSLKKSNVTSSGHQPFTSSS